MEATVERNELREAVFFNDFWTWVKALDMIDGLK